MYFDCYVRSCAAAAGHWLRMAPPPRLRPAMAAPAPPLPRLRPQAWAEGPACFPVRSGCSGGSWGGRGWAGDRVTNNRPHIHLGYHRQLKSPYTWESRWEWKQRWWRWRQLGNSDGGPSGPACAVATQRTFRNRFVCLGAAVGEHCCCLCFVALLLFFLCGFP